MKKTPHTKKYLLEKRARFMKFLKEEDYSGSDIAFIFSVDKSAISRILSSHKKYKEFAKELLNQ